MFSQLLDCELDVITEREKRNLGVDSLALLEQCRKITSAHNWEM